MEDGVSSEQLIGMIMPKSQRDVEGGHLFLMYRSYVLAELLVHVLIY